MEASNSSVRAALHFQYRVSAELWKLRGEYEMGTCHFIDGLDYSSVRRFCHCAARFAAQHQRC